ncbi:MAG: DUF5054 domain-containing protein [Propionibacteriaceae bacterium]|jgi:hypothetical protein|nr:DUF5054 domain-containing protein [Propionibacteriaceae bacterium]
MSASSDESVEQVLIMFKCHLDVGFTDTTERVIQRYLEVHIPRAADVAATMRQTGEDRFVWTVPAWLLHRFLNEGPRDHVVKVERAIVAGDVAWHALPFTWYTELLDRSAVAASLGFSAWLDQRFGVTTTAARMTDVPGHTRGLVGPLADAGVTFLDIGCNPGCTPPAVPWAPGVGLAASAEDVPDRDQWRLITAEPANEQQGAPPEELAVLAVEGMNSPKTHLFRWREDTGKEIEVLYHPRAYGSTVRLPGVPVALSMRVHNDNGGPHSPEAVRDAYATLRRKFPRAQVEAANLSRMGAVVHQVREALPVLTSEIGDTWIYGTGSDPAKSGDLREILRARAEWIDVGALSEGGPEDLALLAALIPAPEHNWGLSTAAHLQTWDTYEVGELAAARAADAQHQANDAEWEFQRGEPAAAAAGLPEPLRSEAAARLEARRPPFPEATPPATPSQAVDPTLASDHVALRLDPATGGIAELTDRRTGRQWAGPAGLAVFSYDAHTTEDYRRFNSRYNTASFAANDFGKPGLDRYDAPGRSWRPAGASFSRDGDALLAVLAAPPEAAADSGLTAWPARIALRYRLVPDRAAVDIEVWTADKPANRRPEAMWLSFGVAAPDPGGWRLRKLGQWIEPNDVVDNGGRRLHGVQDRVEYKDPAGGLAIETLDAHLVSVGEKGLLRFDNDRIDPRAGVHVVLYDNLWGTAFPQWYDQDAYFRFRLDLRSDQEVGQW